jgi:hypothetical protein
VPIVIVLPDDLEDFAVTSDGDRAVSINVRAPRSDPSAGSAFRSQAQPAIQVPPTQTKPRKRPPIIFAPLHVQPTPDELPNVYGQSATAPDVVAALRDVVNGLTQAEAHFAEYAPGTTLNLAVLRQHQATAHEEAPVIIVRPKDG